MRTNTSGLKVKSSLKAGKLATNHNVVVRVRGLAVTSGLRAGKLAVNHSTTPQRIA